MDYYEPLPDFGEYGIFLEFEDKRNEIEEWIDNEYKAMDESQVSVSHNRP